MFVNKALLERSLALLPGSDGSLQQTGVVLTCLGRGSIHHVKQTQLLAAQARGLPGIRPSARRPLGSVWSVCL